MNFTCNERIVAFTFAGINQVGGTQDPRIQIWRKNISQPDVYQKTGPPIPVNNSQTSGVCADGLLL